MTLRWRTAPRLAVWALAVTLAGLVLAGAGSLGLSRPALAAAGTDLLPVPQGGRVADAAGVLGGQAVQELNRIIAGVEAQNGVEIAVATVPSAAPRTPDEYATALFAKWGVGKKDKDNGLLVLLAMEERRVKVEVGYGLEGIFNDGRIGRLLDEFALPALKQGKYGEGLVSLVGEMARIAGAEYGMEGGTAPEQPARSGRNTYGTVGSVSGITLFLVFFMVMMVVNALKRPVRHRCPKCGSNLTEEQEHVRAATEEKDGLMRVHFHCSKCGYDRLADVVLPALIAGAIMESERRRFRGPFGGGWGGFGGGGWGGGGGFGGGGGGFGGGSSGGGGGGRGF